MPTHGLVVLETASEPITRTCPGMTDYRGDTSTYFVPSLAVLLKLVRERGFNVEIVRNLGQRVVLFMRAPGPS